MRPLTHQTCPLERVRAVRNVAWFRASIDLTSVLFYFQEPAFEAYADRLVADTRMIGAHPFEPVVGQLVTVGTALCAEAVWDPALVEVEADLEHELLELELRHGSLWWHLAEATRLCSAPSG